MKRHLYLFLGLVFTGVGIIGAFLPVLPSTCFFIIAAYYFGLSSKKLESWMLNHPRIGPTITSWRKYRAIPKLGKIMATAGMSFSAVVLVLSGAPIFVKIGGVLTLVFCAFYVLSRPTLDSLVQIEKNN